MKRILITGARAPAALELVRQFSRAGHSVYAADCLHFPPTRFSKYVRGYLRHASPRREFLKCQEQLAGFVREKKIDLVVPTCEEVFYLSAMKPVLGQHAAVFCEAPELLGKLHNKAAFQQLARENGMNALETLLLERHDALEPLKLLSNEQRYVLKPAYSRFGDKAVLNVAAADLEAHLRKDLFPWTIQEYVEGEEYCAYAICVNGAILFQSLYRPTYRAGRGSSVYFDPVTHEGITRQVETLVRKLKYTGQIGFDFMAREDGEAVVLECNPRCTSGVHFIPDGLNLDAIFTGNVPPAIVEANDRPRMVSAAMWVYGMRRPNSQGFRAFLRACRQGEDVVGCRGDRWPIFGQFAAALEISLSAITQGISLKDASTKDIEWDGQEIG